MGFLFWLSCNPPGFGYVAQLMVSTMDCSRVQLKLHKEKSIEMQRLCSIALSP